MGSCISANHNLMEVGGNNESEEETEVSPAEFGAVKEVLEQNMDEDKQQLLSLQDSLTGCRGEQRLDIGDIWRYLHRERDAEWLTESQDTPLSISADSLREKVAKEIKTLKTQLVRNEAALQALEGHALPAALGRAGYKYKTVGDSLLGTLSLGDLCNEAVSGPSKLDSTSCPHLGEKHNIGLTQTETKTRTSCLVQKRRAPHVKNSKYALLNSSTGSSTSGVDVSSISSRSDSQHKSVCILETPIDCPSSPDSDNPLVRQRSQSFRLAIERGASIDSSLPSCDTSPDLSPQCSDPVSYTEYLNKDKNQHLTTLISKQVINSGAHEHGDKTDKSDQSNNCPDTTRTQKSRTKHELNSNNTDFKVEMDTKNKEIGLILGTDENDSPHSRRLSTLVEESDQETEEFHLVHLHSPRSPNSPSYLRGSSKKHRTQSLPRYKEPPSYKDIIHNQSRASPQSNDNRFGHHRSRSLSPDHHYLRTASPGYHSDVLVSTSLPASPQIIAQSKSHQAKLEFKPSASGQSSTTTSKISEKETRVVGSKGSDNHNVIVKKDGELNNNVTTSKNQRSGDVKVRRKSLHDMRQSSCNVVLINKTEDGITEKMEETLHARPVQDTSNTVVTNNESSKSNHNLTENTNTCEKRKQNESRDKPSLDICQTTATLAHNKDNSSSDAQTIKDNLAKRRQLQKQPTTMPDLTEVSGGERCEHDSNTSLIVKSGQNEEVKAAFPSLSDVFLEKMKLFPGRKDKVKTSIDQTPEQEIEEKFVRLSLAFKTDKLTLDKRVELHQRARDVAEQNIEEQLASVKEALKVLGPLCKDTKTREVFSKIEHHVDVLGSSTARMSSRAEILGAVKQEYRISEAIDVMIQHVENLKQSLERDHAELEEAKRMLMESRHVVEADAILHRKSLSITSHGSKVGRRRASVAVLPKTPVLPPTGTKNTNATTDDLDTKNKLETSTSSHTLCTLSLPLVLDWIPKPAPVHRPSTEHSARESLSPSNSQSTKYNNSIEQGTKTERCEANNRKGKMQHTADFQLHLVNGNGGHHDDDNVQLSDDELEIADEIFPDLQNLLNLFHYLAAGLIILLGFCMLMPFIILEDTDDWFYLYFKYKPG